MVLDGELLGKPRDEVEAQRMLGRLSGREHLVHTGVELTQGPRRAAEVATTRVRMAELGADTIGWYVGTGEPMDKAGAYGAQGLGAVFVESYRGNYFNVVGLPLPTVRGLAAELGYDLFAFRDPG